MIELQQYLYFLCICLTDVLTDVLTDI